MTVQLKVVPNLSWYVKYMIYQSNHSQTYIYCYSFCETGTEEGSISAGPSSSTTTDTMLPTVIPVKTHTPHKDVEILPSALLHELSESPSYLPWHPQNISRISQNIHFCLCNVTLKFSTDYVKCPCLYLHVPGWLIQLAAHHFPMWFPPHLPGSRKAVEGIYKRTRYGSKKEHLESKHLQPSFKKTQQNNNKNKQKNPTRK